MNQLANQSNNIDIQKIITALNDKKYLARTAKQKAIRCARFIGCCRQAHRSRSLRISSA